MDALEAAKSPGFLEARAARGGDPGALGARALLELLAAGPRNTGRIDARLRARARARAFSYYTGPIFEISVPGSLARWAAAAATTA
jgi:hypothetical protein